MRQPGEVVIDLGPLEPGAAAAAAAGARSRPGSELVARLRWLHRRWAGRRGARLLAPVLVVALLLGSVSGAGRPAFQDVVTIGLPPGQVGFEVVGDQLFVGQGFEWMAYRLATGEAQWSVTVTDGFQLAPIGDSLVHLRGGFGLDPVTGRVRWSRPGTQVATGAGIGLARGGVRWSRPGSRAGPGAGIGLVTGGYREHRDGPLTIAVPYELTGVDLASGEEIWHERLAVGERAWLVGEPPVVVTVSVEGQLGLRDPATGHRRAVTRSVPSSTVHQTGPPMLWRDQLVLTDWTEDCPADLTSELPSWYPDSGMCRSLVGYRFTDLAPMWQRPVGNAVWATQCGPMLCVHSNPAPARDPTGVGTPQPQVQVVDPATGVTRWRIGTENGSLTPVGEWLFRHDQDGRLRAAVDPWTGRPVRDLTGWELSLPAYLAGTQLTLVRRDPEPGAAAVATLDLITLELTEQAWVPGTPERCLPFEPGPAESGLVCQYRRELWAWSW